VAYSQLQSEDISKNRLGFSSIKTSTKKCNFNDENSEYAYLVDGEAHWEIVERILYIFAKLNTGNSYVQGMNEIVGPIYYIFANDPDLEWRRNAEADCFFCFTNLMGLEGVRENFVKELDNSEWGISSNMKRLYDLVKLKDPPVYSVLESQNLKPEFFAFRWISLILSQEFQLPDVISIWDCLFAEKKLLDLLMHVCCSMILMQREFLLKSDFSNNIKILQSYPPVDVQLILTYAKKLRQQK
jgi:TBC1 domain family member 13